MKEGKFALFSLAHWIIILSMLVLPLILSHFCEWGKNPIRVKGCAWILAFLLFLNKLVTVYIAYENNNLALQNGLPMHLCDWASFAVILVLIFQWRKLFEVCYFWGLGGTFQAILTPDLNVQFPDLRFITFFVSHCGIVSSLIFLIFCEKMRPYPRSLFLAFGWTQVYLLITLIVNKIVNANYGYLSAKPHNPSLLDYFGPWPTYILWMEVLMIILFTTCYLPFYFKDKFISSSPHPQGLGDTE
jgi:hypothetical integral membrane protein (TIGR02206 family)